ncbi:hypothetical protein [Candidatus Poriferisodalis sp.]|uniref:hypothetical protein n=1 Tax=Candidatus Poriferisodalis sp. TaxID=3101277 RepID=UPI003D0CEBF7
MSEQHRSRIYAWIRDQHDEPTAEYLMSCLAPSPVSDLVTKEFLAAELSRFATKEEMGAGFAALRREYADQRAEDRREHAAQRTEDQRAAQHRHYWQMGVILAAATPIWLDAFGIIG